MISRSFAALLLLLPLSADAGDRAYEFIIDLSGSMNRYQAGASLKTHALGALVTNLPHDAPFAVRVFGHRIGLEDKERSCKDSELLTPLGYHPADEIRAQVKQLRAQGYTPLAHALRFAEDDLSAHSGKKVVILLSDGVDSCDGDPAHEIEQLKQKGIAIVINPIGIGLDTPARKQLTQLAEMTGGVFADIKEPSELARALDMAIAHVPDAVPAGTPAKLPGDLGQENDAGDFASAALEVRKSDWMVATIGAVRGALRDSKDYFTLRSSSGEKFTLELEILSGTRLHGRIVDTRGATLGEVSESALQSDPILVPNSGDSVGIVFTNPDGKEIRYRFRILPLVEIE